MENIPSTHPRITRLTKNFPASHTGQRFIIKVSLTAVSLSCDLSDMNAAHILTLVFINVIFIILSFTHFKYMKLMTEKSI
jgi:hypothetical protein